MKTIRLYCAQADATVVINACLCQSLLSLETLTLAVDCVEEALTVQAEAKEKLYSLLEQGVNDADPTRRRIIAEALLKRRLRHMRSLQETTCIDTSLVTRAEYQLFPDEQPVSRPDQAQAFCGWLTERDPQGQSYRLPRQDEMGLINTSIGHDLPRETGYREDGKSFVWPHGTLSQSFLSKIFAHAIVTFTSTQSSTLASDLAVDLATDRAFTADRALVRVRDLNHSIILALDLASALNPDLKRTLVRARGLASDLNHIVTSDLACDLASALYLTRDHSQGCACNLSDLALTRDMALDIYALLFLLSRPAGLFPADEGILLVRESQK